MKLFGFKIGRVSSLKENPFSLGFLIAALVCFFGVAYQTSFFANYRLGDSIIPHENQLIRTGPFIAKVASPPHSGYRIDFLSLDGRVEYSEKWTDFNRGVDIMPLVGALRGRPAAYLWLYSGNPVRKVWKIEIDGQDVYSYENALSVYRYDSDNASLIDASILCFLAFLLTMLTVTRVPNAGQKEAA